MVSIFPCLCQDLNGYFLSSLLMHCCLDFAEFPNAQRRTNERVVVFKAAVANSLFDCCHPFVSLIFAQKVVLLHIIWIEDEAERVEHSFRVKLLFELFT